MALPVARNCQLELVVRPTHNPFSKVHLTLCKKRAAGKFHQTSPQLSLSFPAAACADNCLPSTADWLEKEPPLWVFGEALGSESASVQLVCLIPRHRPALAMGRRRSLTCGWRKRNIKRHMG